MHRFLRLAIFFSVLFFSFITAKSPSFASCEDAVSEANVDQIIADCTQKLQDLAGQKKTLSATLSYLNTQITLMKTKIAKTQRDLSVLKSEIDTLTGKIGELSASQDEVLGILSRRVRETYIRSQDNPLYLFFTSSDFPDFISRYKYMRTVQNHDKEILTAMERIRSNYNVQKTDKQQKQDEIKKLSDQLKIQNDKLAAQQREKQQLLEMTKNDERKYQQLLAEAEAQKRAFSRFVVSQGGASILSGQTKCDGWGCYYNQRDSQWGLNFIGDSPLTVATDGCLVSSVAMVATHNGKNLNPGDVAAESGGYVPGTALMIHLPFRVKGVQITITAASSSRLDSELAAGHPVIAGLYSGPDHFIVIKGKTDNGYIMNDPFLENGADRPLTDKYKVSDITSLRLVNFN